MATAYITLRKDRLIYPVEYSIGPLIEEVADVKIGWYRNSFPPTPIGATHSANFDVGIGPGSANQNNATIKGMAGSYVYDGSATAVVIAVPDDMKTSPVAPRTLEHGKSFLVFYGGTSAGLAFTRASNTLVLAAGHGLRNGQLVTVTSTTALPGGLDENTFYYVRARAATTVELSLTVGGAAVTLSSDGTGPHSVVPFGRTGWFDMADGPNFSNTEPIV